MSSLNGSLATPKSLNNNSLLGDIQIDGDEISGVSSFTAETITAITQLQAPQITDLQDDVSLLQTKTINISYSNLGGINRTTISGNVLLQNVNITGITIEDEDINVKNLQVLETTNLFNTSITGNLVISNVNINTKFSNLESNVSILQGNIITHSSRLSNLESNVSILQGNIISHNSRISNLESNVSILQGNIITHNSRITILEGNISNVIVSNISSNGDYTFVLNKNKILQDNSLLKFYDDEFNRGFQIKEKVGNEYVVFTLADKSYYDANISEFELFGSSNTVINITNDNYGIRIDKQGNVGIGSTTTDYKLDVSATAMMRDGILTKGWVEANDNTRSFLKMETNRSGVFSRIGRHATSVSSSTLFSVNLNRDDGTFKKDNVSYPAHYFSMSETGTINMGYLNSSNTAVDLLNINTSNELTTINGNVKIDNYSFVDSFKGNVSLTNCMTEGFLASLSSNIAHPASDLTSNSQNGIICSASVNNTNAYIPYNSTLGTWDASQSTYNLTSGDYTGSTTTRIIGHPQNTSDYYQVKGEWNQIQFPYNIIPVSIFVETPTNNNSVNDMCLLGSKNGSEYYYLKKVQQYNGVSGTWTWFLDVFDNISISYFRFVMPNKRPTTDQPLKIGRIIIYGYRTNENYLTYIPNYLEVGQSKYNTFDSNVALMCNGDLKVNGIIKSSLSGVLIQSRFISSSITNSLVLSNTLFTSTTYTDLLSFTYTALLELSYIEVECDCSYIMVGTLADDWYSRITVGGTKLIEKNQKFNNGGGGGTRSTVLFPIKGVILNSSIGNKDIKIQIKRGTADDNLTVSNEYYVKVSEYSL